jgi:hypothetical protein
MIIQRAAAVALLALAAGCEPALFSAELDVPEVCFHGIDVTVPGSSLAALTSDPLSFADVADGIPEDLDVQVEVLELGLRPAGLPDLDFIDSVGVSMQPQDPTAPRSAVALAELGADSHQADGTMRARTGHPIDVTDFLAAGPAVFALDLDGEMPTAEWHGTMDVCVHTQASYRKDF